MYYNNSPEIRAQIKHKSRKNRGIAVAIWIVLCAILAAFISSYYVDLFGEFGHEMILEVIPIMVIIMAVCSAVFYCRSYEYTRETNRLRAGSRVLFIMSLVMLVFIVLLWMIGVSEVKRYLIEEGLRGTSGASGAWLALIVLVPISAASIVGFLAFLIAFISLKIRSKKILTFISTTSRECFRY